MTPSQIDHMRRIDAHLASLLENAKKRTPGRWVHFVDQGQVGDVSTEDHDSIAMTQERIEVARMADIGGHWRSRMNEIRNYNATFIASCAGNAEAGWESTRETIAWILFEESAEVCAISGQMLETLAAPILAQWPEELLNA